MTRGRLVIGNWKMNPESIADAVALARTVGALPRGTADVGVAPSAIALAAAVPGRWSGGGIPAPGT